jgi:hypothetical protein
METNYAASLGQHLSLCDKRLNDRYTYMLEELGKQVGRSIPQAFQNPYQAKGAYRFFSHKEIKYEMLLKAETKRLLTLVEEQELPVLLTIQDTTEATYTGSRASGALGTTTHDLKRGLFLHNHLALNEQGEPLGLFDQFHFSRVPETFGTVAKKRKVRPFEEKESHRWLVQFDKLQDAMAKSRSMVIDICDQEADIHELLQARRYDHIHYVIRSRGDRKAEGSELTIREDVAQTPVIGTYELEVKDEKGKYIRTATLSVRATQLTVGVKIKYKRKVVPTTLTVLLTAEENAPEGAEAIDWLLTTSLQVNDLADALKVIGYYVMRWRIEVYHYVLKQGYLIEDLQLKTPQALQNAIALYSCLAVQVMRLRYMQEQDENTTMQQAGMDPTEYKVAALYLNKKAKAKYDVNKHNPTLQDFVTVLAQLGGSMLQKNKPIGIKVLWRGLLLLQDLMAAYQIFKQEEAHSAGETYG